MIDLRVQYDDGKAVLLKAGIQDAAIARKLFDLHLQALKLTGTHGWLYLETKEGPVLGSQF